MDMMMRSKNNPFGRLHAYLYDKSESDHRAALQHLHHPHKPVPIRSNVDYEKRIELVAKISDEHKRKVKLSDSLAEPSF